MKDDIQMLKDRVLRWVTNRAGIKVTEIAKFMATDIETQNMSVDCLFEAIDQLVGEKKIIAVSYVLIDMDYRQKMILFPGDAIVSIMS